jgi:hypothetical protein
MYLTLKQKRKNPINKIYKTLLKFRDIYKDITIYSTNPLYKRFNNYKKNSYEATTQCRTVKKSKNKIDITKLINWNRLLRAIKILVLPSHVSITVITNSFDIVHS